MITRERLEELRKVASGDDPGAVPSAEMDELAELLAAYDVAEAAAKVEREYRDRRVAYLVDLNDVGSPTGTIRRVSPSFQEEAASWQLRNSLRRYEQAKQGTPKAVLLDTINKGQEASA